MKKIILKVYLHQSPNEGVAYQRIININDMN
jgi:hypothetical protein